MRRKDESKKPIIVNYINDFFYEHDKIPTVREIVEGIGIPLSTVHRYLVDMQEKGELSYNGYRSARTKEMSEVAPIHGIAVLGTVACGPGQEEEQRFVETMNIAFAVSREAKNESELIPLEYISENMPADFAVVCPKCKHKYVLYRHRETPNIPFSLLPIYGSIVT